MAPKTIKKAIKDCLENLSEGDFKKFRQALVDRKAKPRVATSRVEGKDFLVVTNVIFTTFGEAKAPDVVIELLRECEINEDDFESQTKKVSVAKRRKKESNPPSPDRPRLPAKRKRSLAEASQSGIEDPESKNRKRPKVNGVPALPKTSSGALETKPSQEALKIAADKQLANARGPVKKPEEVEADAKARVRSEGGDPTNKRLVLSRFIIQFGQYKGQTFKWLLENHVGYAVFVVATHRKERKRKKDQSPLMVHKDSFTRYTSTYRDVMKNVRLYRFAGQPSTASSSRPIRGKQKRSRKKK